MVYSFISISLHVQLNRVLTDLQRLRHNYDDRLLRNHPPHNAAQERLLVLYNLQTLVSVR